MVVALILNLFNDLISIADFMLGTPESLKKPLPAPPPISSKVICYLIMKWLSIYTYMDISTCNVKLIIRPHYTGFTEQSGASVRIVPCADFLFVQHTILPNY